MEIYKPKGYKVQPRSTREIATMASSVRTVLGIGDFEQVDVVKVVECTLARLFEKDGYIGIITRPDEEMCGAYAKLVVRKDCSYIEVAESVYLGASEGNARDRFTLAHELGHFCLDHYVGFARNGKDEDHRPFEDSEWQANCFAGEFLAPSSAIAQEDMSIDEIVDRYNVSAHAASIQIERAQNTKGNRVAARSPLYPRWRVGADTCNFSVASAL